jgi:uncharacterized protein (TIGR03437 family)
VNGNKIAANGVPYVSHNGEWGLSGWFGPGAAASALNLRTGDRGPLTPRVFGITNTGDLVRTEENTLYLGTKRVATALGPILAVAHSADGSRIVYVTRRPQLSQDVLDIREGSDLLVSILSEVAGTATALRPVLSADGGRMLVAETVLSKGRAYWYERGQSTRHDLGPLRDPSAATLSGDGRTAWIVPPDGRITRVALDRNERTAIGPALPVRFPALVTLPKGSLYRLAGTDFDEGPWRLSASDQESSAASLTTLPAIEAKSDHLDFQIPWNAPWNYAWIGFSRPGDVFEQVVTAFTPPAYPTFWSIRDRFFVGFAPVDRSLPYVIAAHQAFDTLVTPENPGRPGEVVHIYMGGLGPVAPAQPDFVPASATSAQLTSPITCQFAPAVPARLLYAGLAPGLVGVYQVDLEVPQAPHTGFLGCTVAPATGPLAVTGYLPSSP